NRIKIIIDIFTQLKEKLDKKFPIIIKLTVQDFLGEGKGLALKEGVEITKYLVDLGFDAIEPTSGRTNMRVTINKLYPIVSFRNSEDENYFVPTAQKLKPIMKDCPLILQGGIRNPLSAENFLKEYIADFISMSRPLIYEPNLPNRWKSGDISPSLCRNCNSCLSVGVRGETHCVIKEKKEKKG
ncbi:MAG: NADH:flavin oxidoreductase, partial [Promethearchaeota archaeon]